MENTFKNLEQIEQEYNEAKRVYSDALKVKDSAREALNTFSYLFKIVLDSEYEVRVCDMRTRDQGHLEGNTFVIRGVDHSPLIHSRKIDEWALRDSLQMRGAEKLIVEYGDSYYRYTHGDGLKRIPDLIECRVV